VFLNFTPECCLFYISCFETQEFHKAACHFVILIPSSLRI